MKRWDTPCPSCRTLLLSYAEYVAHKCDSNVAENALFDRAKETLIKVPDIKSAYTAQRGAIEMPYCGSCGLVVRDEKKHFNWHNALAIVVAGLKDE